jgi:hypothetical protein
MIPMIYLGERARYAAEFLNWLWGSDNDPWVPAAEGQWSALPAPTQWDQAMGGRKRLVWSDQTIIEQAEYQAGSPSEFDRWIDEKRCGRISA